MMRVSLSALLVAAIIEVGSAQVVNAPLNVTAIGGDNLVTVTWNHNPSGTIPASYIVTARPSDLPVIPTSFTTTFNDEFDGTVLDTNYFSVSGSTCGPSAPWSTCIAGQSPSATVSGGAVRLYAPPSQYMLTSSYAFSTYYTMANKYGRNGVGFVERKIMGEIGGSVVFATSVGSDGGLASYPWYYFQSGFVVYDKDANGDPRPFLLFYHRYASPNPSYTYINAIYVRWLTSSGWSGDYRMQIDQYHTNGADLFLIRDNSTKSFRFAYRRQGTDAHPIYGSNGCFSGCSSFEVFDTQINGISWNPASSYVGLYAENVYTSGTTASARTVPLLSYKIMTLDWFANSYMKPIMDSRARNATIASAGVCAVSREMRRVIPYPLTRTAITGIYNGESYFVSVQAQSATGVLSPVANVPTAATARPPDMGLTPINVPSPPQVGLFLDGLSVRPTGTGDFTFWRDVSGGGHHFSRRYAQGSAPKVPFPTATDRLVGLQFPQNYVELTQDDPNDDFLSLPAAQASQCQYILGNWNCPGFDQHDTTWFILYRPLYQYNSAGLFSKGNSYGGMSADSSWEIVSMYYGWPDSYLGMRIHAGNNVGGAVSQKFLTQTYTHPHHDKVTLLSYAYRFENYQNPMAVFSLNAAEGLETESNLDKASFPIRSLSNAISTSSPWRSDFVMNQYGPNFASVTTGSPTSDFTAVKFGAFPKVGGLARIGDARVLSGWTNYYYGYIYAIAVFRGANAITETANRKQVQAYLMERYFMLCPSISPPGALSACNAGPEGATCSVQCTPPLVRVGGPALGVSMTCQKGAWFGRGTQCGAVCKMINQPANAKSCKRILHQDNFNTQTVGSDLYSDYRYDTSPGMPGRLFRQYFTIATGGLLQATLPGRDDSCSLLDPVVLHLNAPAWTDVTNTVPEYVEVSADVLLSSTSARAGVAARVYLSAGKYSYYAMSIGHGTLGATLFKVINSAAPVPTGTSSIPTFNPQLNTWYNLRIVVAKTSIKGYVNGTLAFDTADNDISVGGGGLYVENGLVLFDNFVVSAACDSSGNCQGSSGETCQYACADGYTLTGNASMVCDINGQYLGTMPVCVPTPPDVKPATFSVMEDAPQGFVIGRLNATSMGAGREVIIYKAISHTTPFYSNTETLYSPGATPVVMGTISDVFGINLCSGDIYISKAGILNYRGFDPASFPGTLVSPYQRKLTVRAMVGNKQDVYTDVVVTINLIRAIKPPVFLDPVDNTPSLRYFRSVAENYVGSFDIPVAATPMEPNPLVYDIIFGNSLGFFSINNNTGQLFVAKMGLDFEDPDRKRFEIMVRARDSVYPDKSAIILVEVTVNDAEDAPYAESPQAFKVSESRATANLLLGSVRASDQDIGDLIKFSVDKNAAGDQYNYLTSTVKVNETNGEVTLLRTLFYDPELSDVKVVDGLQVREAFKIPCLVTDTYGPKSTPFQVVVYILANLTTGPEPMFSSIRFPAEGVSTKGNQTVLIGGENFQTILNNNNNVTDVWVNFTTQDSDPTTYGSYCSPKCKACTDPYDFNCLPEGCDPLIMVCTPCAALKCPRTYPLKNCFIQDGATLQCTTVEGYGQNLVVQVRHGKLRKRMLSPEAAVFVNYARPTIVSVAGALEPGRVPDNPAALPTDGGSSLILKVREFGPQGMVLPYMNARLKVEYGPNFEYAADVDEVIDRYGNLLYPDRILDELKIRTKPGIGKNMPFRVTAGLVTSYDSAVTISYAPPVIQSITVPTGSDYNTGTLSTLGQERFFIRGANFGPYLPQLLRYSSQQNVPVEGVTTPVLFSYTPVCEATATPHSVISCLSAPGVGKLHAINMIVGNQSTTSSGSNLLSYLPPVVTSMDGEGTFLADTQGGQKVNLKGRNMGPISMGDDADGAAHVAPISATYGPTGIEYIAQSCLVSSTDAASITCLTAPGTGKGHVWNLNVGGQAAPLYRGNTSYAPPVITAFTRVEVDPDTGLPLPTNSYRTNGAEAVVIDGKNFGPSIVVGKFSATYTLSLRENKTEYNTFVGGDANAQITFPATACQMTTAHFQLVCRTTPGAGTDLGWTLVVDSQPSTQPVIAYGAPVINTVRDASGNPIGGTLFQDGNPYSLDGVSTDGGDTIVLRGKNFGPRDNVNCKSSGGWLPQHATQPVCHGYVQSVRYGRTGTEYSVADFDVASEATHDIIYVKIAPGFGKNLRFRVTIAGQVSDLSEEAFSYRSPRVTMITPSAADTNPSATNVIKITVEGYDFSLLDPLANVGIVFGNQADGTIRPGVLPVVDRTPDWQDKASVAAYTPGSKHTLTFHLPQGVMDLRAVRVAVFLNGQASGYRVLSEPPQDAVITDPQNPPVVFFSYNPPAIESTSLSVIDPTNAVLYRWVLNNIPSITTSTMGDYYVLTLIGNNFGPNASATNDRVGRSIQFKPYDDQGSALWTEGRYFIFSWSHNVIIAVTKEVKAKVRVAFAGNKYDGTPSVYASDSYDYADLSPSVGNLMGNTGPFPTLGNVIISFSVSNLKSARTLLVQVGGRRCDVVYGPNDPNGIEGDPVADVLNDVVRNPLYFDPDPPAPDTNRLWTIYCMLPPGQGRGQPIAINSDRNYTVSGVTIDYEAPRVTSIVVGNLAGAQTFTFVSGQALTINVDTEPSVIQIYGTNFGLCPSIQMAAAPRKQLGLRVNRCPTFYVAGVNYSSIGLGTYSDHENIRIRSDPGQGSGLDVDPIYGYRLDVEVGGQFALDNGVPQIIQFRYTPPRIATVTPTGRTAGGDLITITGTNFGAATPVVHIGKTGTGEPGMLPCSDVAFNRLVSPTSLTCTLAEGSGAKLDVRVAAGNQAYIAAANFSYLTPSIHTVLIDSEGKATQTIPLGSGANRVRARGGSTGGYNVTLLGDNFGAYDNSTVHCLFVAWRGDNVNLPLVCNRQYDIVGEGEIPDFAIVAWNHTALTFTMPPGAGVREIVPLIRRQRPTPFAQDGLIWYYNTPSITAELEPNHGTADGGTLITIKGADFGQAPLDTSNPTIRANQLVFPTRIQDYLTLSQAPQQIMTVGFFKLCITGHLDQAGDQPAIVGSCIPGIRGHKHGEIKYLTPAYIGVNRSVTVTIHDYVFDFTANRARYINFTSNVALFNYDPPKITQLVPAKVRMDGTANNRLGMWGDNMGNLDAWAASCDWSPQERVIKYAVAGIPCTPYMTYSGCAGDADPLRPGPVSRAGTVRFECQYEPSTVGHKNLTYTMVGQSNYNTPDELGSVFAVCAPNFFGRPGETCAECPYGSFCGGFDDRLRDPSDNQTYVDRGVHTYPRPIYGFYNMNSTDTKNAGMLANCPEEVAAQYPGRDVCIVSCLPTEACLGDNICAYGYRSVAPYFRCATCDIGFYKRANECVKCPDSPWALVIGFALLVAVGGAAAYTLNKKKINLAFISIGIDYFQVLAIFAQSKVKWPEVIKELFHVLSAFNLNIEIVAPECIVPDLQYKQKWSFIMALPLSIAIFFGIVTLFVSFYKGFIKGRKVKLINQFASLAASIFLLMYVLYIYLTRNVLDIFNCVPPEHPDGKKYLTAVAEECGLPGGTQMTLMPAAVVALIVYVLGYPGFVAFLLYQNREVVMEDQLLRAKGVGDDKLTNPRGYQFRKRFSRVYYQFRPETYMWVEAILLRKFLLSITYILFNNNAAFQLAAALLIMVLAFSAQVRFNPYMSPGDVEDVLRAHDHFVAQGDKQRLRIQDKLRHVETRGRKRVHRNVMTGEGKVDAKALLGLLGGWLFNYNTVEAIMIFSAVIVSLMGIMYAAQGQASSYYSEARDAVTAVVLAVVIVSILYFVLVMFVEVSTIMSEANRRKAIARRATQKRKGDAENDTVKKDREARASAMSSDVLGAPLESMNNPLFADGGVGGATAANIQETILSATTSPSVDLWRLFQSSYAGLQSEVENVSKQLAEAKVQQQKLDQAQAMLAEAGITVELGGAAKAAAGIRKARQEFGPTSTGSEGSSPLSPRAGGLSRAKSIGSFSAKAAAAAGSKSPAGNMALKSLRSGRGGGGGGGDGGED